MNDQPSNLRRAYFLPEIEALAAKLYANPLFTHDEVKNWVVLTRFAQQISREPVVKKFCWLTNGTVNAVAKPIHDDESTPLSIKEKYRIVSETLASLIGYKLGLPVAPIAVLPDENERFSHPVTLSFDHFSINSCQGNPCERSQNGNGGLYVKMLKSTQKNTLPTIVSKAFVFDALISNVDRHPCNILFSTSPSMDKKVCLIDHAASMGAIWRIKGAHYSVLHEAENISLMYLDNVFMPDSRVVRQSIKAILDTDICSEVDKMKGVFPDVELKLYREGLEYNQNNLEDIVKYKRTTYPGLNRIDLRGITTTTCKL